MSSSPPVFEIPDELPVLPLPELVAFPYMVVPVFVERKKSVAAVEDALAGDRLILLLAQRDASVADPGPDHLFRVGTVAMVMRTLRLPDGRLKVLMQGLARAEAGEYVECEPSLWVGARRLPCEEGGTWSVETEALMRSVRGRVEELLPLKSLPPEVLSGIANVQDPGRLSDLVASSLRLRVSEAQEILATVEPIERLRRVDSLLRRELEVTSVQAQIQSQAKEELTRGQREQFLREQLRAIRTELGELDQRSEEVEEYREKLERAGLPEEARSEAFRQLRRLERMHPEGPEAQVVRVYLEWLTDLPWRVTSDDVLDLSRAREVLDGDHAHLAAVKERILELLAVHKLRRDARGPILCFTGPPGVGKTSLGRSIARAMGRSFVRVSLGGIRDEAEIRGHRRTYVGALPGRILQGIKQAGTRNPVFMLDEIDKLGADFRGDPSAALLEVLDPEQNARFSDHYLNVPFDLSRVLFIATANLLDTIPGPLRDRMEVIRLSGYTPEEKLDIARSFLIPRQVEAHGLPPQRIHWSPAALRRITREYTREAGVRDLERQIAGVCRKAARCAAEGDASPFRVSVRALPRLLGPPRFPSEEPRRRGEVGVVTGLAWTEAGGEVLRLEATLTRGRGLVLTGQLGDVMRESGQAALTYARWRSPHMGVDETVFSRHEVHVHIPAGAIPKDGPSAGVAIATAMLSLATGLPVRPDVAMTGEVTLRGRVLAVGGVREKSLAALRSGITRVILPRANLRDLDRIPHELKRRIRFIPVTHMDEVLDAALSRRPSRTDLRPAAPPAQRRARPATPAIVPPR